MALTARQIHEAARRYPDQVDHFEKEEEMLDILPVAFAEGTWTDQDLEDIFEWKSQRFGPTNIERLQENSTEDIEDAISFTVRLNPTMRVLDRLQKLKGIKTPKASALLLFSDPATYTVIDRKAWGALFKWDYLDQEYDKDPTVNDYLRYLGVCHTLASQLEMDLRTLDRGSWILGGE